MGKIGVLPYLRIAKIGKVSIMPTVIDWFNVLANGLWILGLAVLLAAVSYHSWEAEERGRPLREQLGQDSFMRAAWVSLILVGLGLAGTSGRWWEAVVWGIFVVVGLYYLLKGWRIANRVKTNGS